MQPEARQATAPTPARGSERKVRTLTNFVSECTRNHEIEYSERSEEQSFANAQDASIRNFASLRRIGQVAAPTPFGVRSSDFNIFLLSVGGNARRP